MKYICSQDSCQYSTDKKSNFNRHLKTHGLNPLDEEIKLYCAVEDCSQHFPSTIAYEKHLNVCHNIELKRTIFEVPDVKAFEAFIVKIIESEKAFFKRQGPLHHICNRNSSYKPKIDEKTMCTSKKAEKYFGIGKRCPAHIFGKKNQQGTITITYCETHLGHVNDIQWMRLPSYQSKILVQELKDGGDRGAIQRKYQSQAVEFGDSKITNITRMQLYKLDMYYGTNKK